VISIPRQELSHVGEHIRSANLLDERVVVFAPLSIPPHFGRINVAPGAFGRPCHVHTMPITPERPRVQEISYEIYAHRRGAECLSQVPRPAVAPKKHVGKRQHSNELCKAQRSCSVHDACTLVRVHECPCTIGDFPTQFYLCRVSHNDAAHPVARERSYDVSEVCGGPPPAQASRPTVAIHPRSE